MTSTYIPQQHALQPKPREESKYKPHCKPEEWDNPMDLNSAHWLFFEIDPPQQPWPAAFQEMCPLTPNQCIWALHHLKQHGGRIELYLTDKTRSTYDAPYVGLIFDQNGYEGHGLGSPHTEDLENEIQALTGKPVDQAMAQLHDIFKRYTQHRTLVLHHPDEVSGTTVIPDWYGKPVKFHWTEGYSDVVIEYPATGLEPRRLDTVPYPDARPENERDPRIAMLDAVSEYGTDDARDMNPWEIRLWTQARQ